MEHVMEMVFQMLDTGSPQTRYRRGQVDSYDPTVFHWTTNTTSFLIAHHESVKVRFQIRPARNKDEVVGHRVPALYVQHLPRDWKTSTCTCSIEPLSNGIFHVRDRRPRYETLYRHGVRPNLSTFDRPQTKTECSAPIRFQETSIRPMDRCGTRSKLESVVHGSYGTLCLHAQSLLCFPLWVRFQKMNTRIAPNNCLANAREVFRLRYFQRYEYGTVVNRVRLTCVQWGHWTMMYTGIGGNEPRVKRR